MTYDEYAKLHHKNLPKTLSPVTRIVLSQSPTTGTFEITLDGKYYGAYNDFQVADCAVECLRKELGLSYRNVRNKVSEGS